jgi:type IV secretion system protein VirB10
MPDTSGVVGQMQDAMRMAAELAGEAGAGDSDPWERTVPGVTGPAVEGSAEPVMVSEADDPIGWERVYEGATLSAVLVTQLSGDFAGPVLAQVSIPFYSKDRQRILIPRGARLLGTAQPVQDQDQSRLAVGFHRLLWPDGRWVDLAFHGLNGVGEGALLDQVNRHYVSMFAAAGAVGVISGLTLQGSNPYAGGRQGFQAGAGQGLGQSSSQILNRFLNRLPTITIRAGHRLRVWVTSDFLVPRPAPHPERMFR